MSNIDALLSGRSSLAYTPVSGLNYSPIGSYGKPLGQAAAAQPPAGAMSSLESATSSSIQSGGAYTSLWHYLMPTAEKIFNFRPGDYYTERMKQHPGVIDARGLIQEQLAAGCQLNCTPTSSGQVPFSLGSLSWIGQGWDLLKTTLGTLTGGWLGSDPDYGTVGSFSSNSSWNATSVNCNTGIADIDFSISNQMGLSSNSRFSYDGTPQQTSMFGDNPFGESGFLGTVYQNWEWNEPISFNPNPACDRNSLVN